MRRAIKWFAIGLGAIVIIAAGVVAYVAVTFDPNDYKANIVDAVQQRTGRTLVLEGDLALSFFPSIGARLGRASLTEPKSTRPFASFDSAHVSVKVWPLLSRQVIVDAVSLGALRLNVERDRSGRMNFEDLIGGGAAATAPSEPGSEGAAPVNIDIARVELSDAQLTYFDQTTGARYRLANLNLNAGRIATGVSTPLELSANVASEKDKARIDTRVRAVLTFDLERAQYKLAKLDLSAKGDYGDLTGLTASVKGDIEARIKSGEYIAQALAVRATGMRPGGDFDLKLDAPTLTLTRDKGEGGKLAIDAMSRDASGRMSAKVTIGSVAGVFSAVKAAPLEASVEMQGPGRAYKARVNGTLNANLDRKTAALDFSGEVDQSKLKGQVAVTRFAPLALGFNLDADQLDVDRLMGQPAAARAPAVQSQPGPSTGAKPAATGGGGSDDTIDLTALKGIDAAGNIRIGQLTVRNIKSSEVRAGVKIAGGRLDVAPFSAQLYQGTLRGTVSAQAAENAVLAVRQTLSGVAIGPLLRDAAQVDTLEGKGTVELNLTTRGATVQALKRALNGTASVNLADGAVKGIDIAGTIRSARARIDELRGKAVQSANQAERTDFTELTASFRITNGVARNDDLSMKSPLLRLAGAGDIDLGDERLNYRLKATVVATSRGQGGRDVTDLAGITVPVQLSGALAAPQWSIDFSGMAAQLAEQRLKDEVLKRIPGAVGQPGAPGGVEEAIKDRLKGLFRR